MVYTNSIGDQKLLQRKITRNPRYANVESRLDTGASLTRFEKRVSDIQENFKIKQNEIFKRVKLSSFAELILQVAEQDRISQLTDYVNNTSLENDECPVPSSGYDINKNDEILNESGLVDGLSENNFCPLPSSGILNPEPVQDIQSITNPNRTIQVPVLQRSHNTFMDVISGTSERDNQNNRQNSHNSQDTTITGTHSNTRGGPQNGRQHTSLMDVIGGNGERYLEKNPEQYSVRGGSAAPSNIGSFSKRGYKDQFARSEPAPEKKSYSNPILNPDAHVNHRGGSEKSRHTTSLMDVISGNGERYLETNQHLYSRSTSRKNSGQNTPNPNGSSNNPILNPEPVQGFQSITNPNRTIPFAPIDQRSYTSLSQVISGTGEKINDSNFEKRDSGDYGVNEQNNKNQDESAYDNCPFLLLDVQKEHLYDRCHIRSAINFDSSALNRTMNPYIPEIMKYMNKDDKIIVVYDENEDLAAKVVTNLTERGINNVFLLSGGLKLIARRGLHNLVTGPYPRVCFREDIEKAKHQIPRRNFEIPGPENLIDQYRKKFTDSELAQLRFELDKYNEESSAASSVFSQPKSARPGARTSIGSSIGGRSRVSTGPPGWK